MRNGILENVRQRDAALQLLQQEWDSYVAQTKELHNLSGEVQSKIPTLELIRIMPACSWMFSSWWPCSGSCDRTQKPCTGRFGRCRDCAWPRLPPPPRSAPPPRATVPPRTTPPPRQQGRPQAGGGLRRLKLRLVVAAIVGFFLLASVVGYLASGTGGNTGQQLATTCDTPQGSCTLVAAVPVGDDCVCSGSFGSFSGTAH